MPTSIRMLIKIWFILCFHSGLYSPVVASSATVDSLQAELSKNLSTTERINVLNDLAYELSDSLPDEAFSYAEEALTLSEDINNDSTAATALVRMGTIKEYTGDNVVAADYLERALQLETDLDHEYGIARASAFLCKVYNNLGMTAEAISACEESIRVFKSLHKYQYVSGSYQDLFNVYKQSGDLQKALETLNQKLGIDSLHGISESMLGTMESFGQIYRRMGSYDVALSNYYSALQAWLNKGDSSKIGGIYVNIGNIYYDLNKQDSATYYFLLSLSIKQKHNPPHTFAENYNNLAAVYNRQLQFDSADYYYRKSIAINTETGNADELARTYYNLGNNFKDQEQYDSAKVYYRRAEKLTPSTILLMDTYYNLYEVYFEFGQYDSANLYHNRHIAVRDSLDHIAREAVRLRDNYEREKLRSASMQADLLRSENENLNKSMTVTILIISLLLLAVIFFAVLKYYQQRKRAQIAAKDAEINKQKVDQLLKTVENKEMSAILRGQETERKRIAQDLHDRLGSMLAMVKIHFKTVEDNLETIKEENKRQYQKANSLLDEACEEVRKISHDMASGVLQKFGLTTALNNLKGSVNETGQLKINLLTFGMEDERLDYRKEINIYRIIQELLSNTLKHAHAKEMTIQLIRKDQNLNILVEDDGTGFNPGKMKPEGMGLKNIQTRVESLNGTLEIDSGKGSGTTTTIDIPLDQ
ncbi:tetratricopeptide repeat protein [Roseivirga sp. BDSF3-8]|uniref:tetratricopeptide repeat-containing sensor histidine kinase n=1 Tax=Roseivirga sp. BDSF3-8 TaxID=3241598 RepID=UPI0035325609